MQRKVGLAIRYIIGWSGLGTDCGTDGGVYASKISRNRRKRRSSDYNFTFLIVFLNGPIGNYPNPIPLKLLFFTFDFTAQCICR